MKRLLFLAPEAKSILARRIGLAHKGNLFPAPNGAQVRNLNKAHEKVLAVCGLAFRVYDLRHTFATTRSGLPSPFTSTTATDQASPPPES